MFPDVISTLLPRRSWRVPLEDSKHLLDPLPHAHSRRVVRIFREMLIKMRQCLAIFSRSDRRFNSGHAGSVRFPRIFYR